MYRSYFASDFTSFSLHLPVFNFGSKNFAAASSKYVAEIVEWRIAQKISLTPSNSKLKQLKFIKQIKLKKNYTNSVAIPPLPISNTLRVSSDNLLRKVKIESVSRIVKIFLL